MKPKERMRAVLEGEQPDRVPTGELGVDYPVTESVLGHPTYYRAKLREKKAVWEGGRDQVVRSQKEDLVELARALEWDFIPVFLTYRSGCTYAPAEFLDDRTWKDPYGRTWKYSAITEDSMCTSMPRIDAEAIDALLEPYVPDPSELELARYVGETCGSTHFIVGRTSIELRDALPFIGGGPVDGSFPEPYGGLMMDMRDFFGRLLKDPDFVKKLLAAATERAMVIARVLIEAGADAIVMDTDYCHQTGPWISPHHFQDIILPLLRRQVETIHSLGAYAIKHTDGRTWAILDMLVEAGIDGLHGIQPSAGMDLSALKERYGTRLALFGAMEGERLINGDPDEIRNLVRSQLKEAGRGGGLVLTSSNSIQLGVRPSNYLAMLDTVHTDGRYPTA